MKTPTRWYPKSGKPDLRSWMLAPLGRLYQWGTQRRIAKGAPVHAPIPVICVGNVTAGGSGKTPVVADLMLRLIAMGHRPCVISKGYGAQSLTKATLVDPNTHTATQVGDEPLFLAGFGPVIVAPTRPEAITHAQQEDYSVLILDDGFQDPSVHKDLSILVIDALKGFGNGLGIPAGPLREAPKDAFARADLIVSLGRDEAQQHLTEALRPLPALPRAIGQLQPLETGMPWQGQRCVAYAGIAAPERFKTTLGSLGVDILHFEPLGDHEVMSQRLFDRLRTMAWMNDAMIVTTEKDAARLTRDQRLEVTALPVRIHWSAAAPLEAALERALPPA